jgi:hypothetical protein
MVQEKKNRINDLRKRLANLSEEQKAAMVQNGMVLSVQGKSLSINNTMLLYLQSDTINTQPTVIGGYRQWQEQGKQVKKGAKSMMIWAPTNRKNDESKEENDEDCTFFPVNVFDISQTETIAS